MTPRSPQLVAFCILFVCLTFPVAGANPPQAPEIVDQNPSSVGVELGLSGDQTFQIDVTDTDTARENLTITWYVNDKQVKQGSSEFNYVASDYSYGANTVQVVVSDGDDSTDDALQSWSVDVYHPPEITSYSPENSPIRTPPVEVVDFTVEITDPDSSINADQISWTVDGEKVAIGRRYALETPDFSPGKHEVVVRVEDGNSHSADAMRSWTVNIRQPPQIYDTEPGSSTLTISENEQITFDVAASDPDTPDDGLVYQWQVNGELVTGDENQFVFRGSEFGAGEYTVRTTVSDGDITPDADHSWSVTVVPIPDIAITEPQSSAVTVGKPVTFTAEASAPEQGQVESIRWKIGNQEFRGRSVQTTFTRQGSVTVTAIVRSTTGYTNRTTRTIQLTNPPPVLSQLQPGTITITAGERITPYAKATDSRGRTLKYNYRWYIDGNEYIGQTVTSAPFNRIGRHVVRVNVTDEYGASITDSFDIFVENDIPAIIQNRSEIFVGSGESARFTPVIRDYDRTPVSVQFYADNKSQPFAKDVVSNASEGAEVVSTKSFSTPGSHTVTVRVVDGHGAVSEASWNVTVGNKPPQFVRTSPERTTMDVLSGKKYEFAVEASDPEKRSIEYQWYFNGSPVGSGAQHVQPVNTSGKHNVSVVAIDADGGRTLHSWSVTASSFNTIPVVTNQSTQSTINPSSGSTNLLTVSLQNPEGNRRTARVEIVLKPIDGITYRRVQNVESASPSSIVGYGNVRPGSQQTLIVGINVDDSLRGKEVEIPYTIRYYPTANKADTTTIENGSIQLTIAEQQSPTSENTGSSTSSTTGADENTESPEGTGGSGPGFGLVIGMVSLFIAVGANRLR